jgi:hypothetical protein
MQDHDTIAQQSGVKQAEGINASLLSHSGHNLKPTSLTLNSPFPSLVVGFAAIVL